MQRRIHWLSNRRASFGLYWLLVGGSTVLLHVFAGKDRFHGSAWYWLYAVLAVVGLGLLVSGVRASRDEQQSQG